MTIDHCQYTSALRTRSRTARDAIDASRTTRSADETKPPSIRHAWLARAVSHLRAACDVRPGAMAMARRSRCIVIDPGGGDRVGDRPDPDERRKLGRRRTRLDPAGPITIPFRCPP
jgi:hypothetical protein